MKFSDVYLQAVPFPSIWCHTSIVLHKPLVAVVVVYKPLAAYVDRRSQAGFWWHTWIVVYKLDGRGNRSQAFGGRRGSSFAGLVGIRGSPLISFW